MLLELIEVIGMEVTGIYCIYQASEQLIYLQFTWYTSTVEEHIRTHNNI